MVDKIEKETLSRNPEIIRQPDSVDVWNEDRWDVITYRDRISNMTHGDMMEAIYGDECTKILEKYNKNWNRDTPIGKCTGDDFYMIGIEPSSIIEQSLYRLLGETYKKNYINRCEKELYIAISSQMEYIHSSDSQYYKNNPRSYLNHKIYDNNHEKIYSNIEIIKNFSIMDWKKFTKEIIVVIFDRIRDKQK